MAQVLLLVAGLAVVLGLLAYLSLAAGAPCSAACRSAAAHTEARGLRLEAPQELALLQEAGRGAPASERRRESASPLREVPPAGPAWRTERSEMLRGEHPYVQPQLSSSSGYLVGQQRLQDQIQKRKASTQEPLLM